MARHYKSKKSADGIGRGFYEGYQARMTQEAQDGSMIYEDPRAIANLPQGVIMREYPKYPGAHYNLNDDIRGIDVQMHDDMKHQKDDKYPEKY